MVSLGSPSSPPSFPPQQGAVQEAISSTLGLGELAFGKGEGLGRYNLTAQGFWRAYITATVIMPILIVLWDAALGQDLAIIPVLVMGLFNLAKVAASCLIIIRVRGILSAEGMAWGGPMNSLGIGTLPFLVPYLWGLTVQNLLFALLQISGGAAAQFLILVVFITTLVAQWRAARLGLGYSAGASVLMMLSFFIAEGVLFFVLWGVLDTLHGGSLVLPLY